MSIANRKPVFLKQTTIDALTLAALSNKRLAGGIGRGEYSHVIVDPKTGESTDCPICLIGQARFLDGKNLESGIQPGPVERELRAAFAAADRDESVEAENDRAVDRFLTTKADNWLAKGKLSWANVAALPWRARGISMPTLMRLLNIKAKTA